MFNAIYHKSILLPASSSKQFRICPWDQSVINLPAGTEIHFHVELECPAIATGRLSIWELYQTRDANGNRLTFNPATVLRFLDRTTPDTKYLVDENTQVPDLPNFGFELWSGVGIQLLKSDEFKVVTSLSSAENDKEWVVLVENMEPATVADLPFSVRIYAELSDLE